MDPCNIPFQEEDLCILWKEDLKIDSEYRDMKKTLINRQRSFPPTVSVEISIAECTMNNIDHIKWRDRFLVPGYEPQQTTTTDRAHDSLVTGHPGREAILNIFSREFYRQNMGIMAKRFVRNCYICNRTHFWRDKKRGFLEPLPIPDRFFQELSLDFITDLPAKK